MIYPLEQAFPGLKGKRHYRLETMLYLGFFFVNEWDAAGREAEGEFTVMVDAGSLERALQDFESYILELQRDGNTFHDRCVVHLKSVIGVEGAPQKAVGVHCRKFVRQNKSLVSLHKPILSDVPEGCEVHCSPETHLEPFLAFEPQGRNHLRVVK